MGRWFTGISPEDRKRKVEEKIIGVITDKGWITWSELYRLLEKEGVSRATLTRHLKNLVEIGVVERRVDTSSYPPKVYYRYSLKSPTHFSEDPYRRLILMKAKEIAESEAEEDFGKCEGKREISRHPTFSKKWKDITILINYIEYFSNEFLSRYLFLLDSVLSLNVQDSDEDSESRKKYIEELKRFEKEVFEYSQQILEIFFEVIKYLYNVHSSKEEFSLFIKPIRALTIDKMNESFERLMEGLRKDIEVSIEKNLEKVILNEKKMIIIEILNNYEKSPSVKKFIKNIENLLHNYKTQAKTE
jgi:DNA-binding transcriptional ArsR family regulator